MNNSFKTFQERGYRRVSPFFVPMMIPDMASGQVSIHFGAKGINSCTVTACASGTNSIGDAFEVIRRGEADVMISGGAEAPITTMAVAGFCANKALSLNPDPEQHHVHLMQNGMALSSVKVQELSFLKNMSMRLNAVRKYTQNSLGTAQQEMRIILQHQLRKAKAPHVQ